MILLGLPTELVAVIISYCDIDTRQRLYHIGVSQAINSIQQLELYIKEKKEGKEVSYVVLDVTSTKQYMIYGQMRPPPSPRTILLINMDVGDDYEESEAFERSGWLIAWAKTA